MLRETMYTCVRSIVNDVRSGRRLARGTAGGRKDRRAQSPNDRRSFSGEPRVLITVLCLLEQVPVVPGHGRIAYETRSGCCEVNAYFAVLLK